MKYSHRFFLWAPVAVLVALLSAAVIHWFVAAGAFAKYIDRANGHEIAPGVTLHFAHRQLAGFPFRIDLILDDLKIDIAASRGPMEWRSEHFAMHTLDYGRVQAIFEAAGKQTISWTGDDGARKSLAFTPGLLRASSIDVDGRLSRFDLELIDAASSELAAASLQFHLRRDPKADSLDIVLNADDLRLSPKLKSAFGTGIKKLRLEATMRPATTLTPLLSGKRDWRSAMGAWNGAFGISGLDVAWAKLEATGSGQLTLDSAHRPRGILNLKIAHPEILATQVERNQELYAAIMDSVLKQPADAAASVRLAFKDGMAYVGDTPVEFVSPLY